jgi:hypothetical protein
VPFSLPYLHIDPFSSKNVSGLSSEKYILAPIRYVSWYLGSKGLLLIVSKQGGKKIKHGESSFIIQNRGRQVEIIKARSKGLKIVKATGATN